MKKTLIALIFALILLEKSYAQASVYKCEDTLFVKVACFNKGKQKSQQMIKIFCGDSIASIKLYDKYTVQIIPKEGLGKEELTIAEILIKTKDPRHLPEQYTKYLSVHINDSSSIVKLLENYEEEQTFNQLKSIAIDCVQKCNEWLMKKAKANLTSKKKKRTKVEFKEGSKTNIYFLDNYYHCKKIFKCLFR